MKHLIILLIYSKLWVLPLEAALFVMAHSKMSGPEGGSVWSLPLLVLGIEPTTFPLKKQLLVPQMAFEYLNILQYEWGNESRSTPGWCVGVCRSNKRERIFPQHCWSEQDLYPASASASAWECDFLLCCLWMKQHDRLDSNRAFFPSFLQVSSLKSSSELSCCGTRLSCHQHYVCFLKCDMQLAFI